MKKFIISVFIVLCTFLAAEKTPVYSNINEIKSFSFYSGNDLDKNDTLIAIIPKKKKYYVNADKLKTNLDIYTVNSIISSADRIMENTKGKNINIKTIIIMNLPLTADRVQKKKFSTINLDDSFIKAMNQKASENKEIFTDLSEEEIVFININLPDYQ